MTEINTVMVVGAGQMGGEIAALAAYSGYNVLLHDIQPAILQQSMSCIKETLTSNISSHKSTDIKGNTILDKIVPSDSLQDSVHCDFIIEAATENLTIKQQIFNTLSYYITHQTIIASNTSSLSISAIASVTDCPDRVIGMHFMNPVSEITLVEIIKGFKTSDNTNEITKQFAISLNRHPIEVNDSPGFVSNRLIMPMINEAVICVFDGVADVQSVDKIMQLGMHHPIGPLKLADMIGLDTCLSIMEILHREFNDPKFRPCPLLRNMVKAGKLGRKSGEGFYSYEEGSI